MFRGSGGLLALVLIQVGGKLSDGWVWERFSSAGVQGRFFAEVKWESSWSTGKTGSGWGAEQVDIGATYSGAWLWERLSLESEMWERLSLCIWEAEVEPLWVEWSTHSFRFWLLEGEC